MKNPIKRLAERCVNYTRNPVLEVEGDLKLGKGVKLGQNCHITARNLYIGDFAAIEAGTVIEATDLFIGDFTRIKRGCFISGTGWCFLGSNCWIGNNSVIDSIGTLYLGNNVAAGVQSQLTSHVAFGDTLKGCTYHSAKPLEVMDDAWFVGHCIVAPVKAGGMSVALPGSVITRDMEANHVYAGIPATDMTDKLGPPFKETTPEERAEKMRAYLEEFYATNPEHRGKVELGDPGRGMDIRFDPGSMLYSKTLLPPETAFMRYLLPWRAKFLPLPEKDWVRREFEKRHGGHAG